MVEIRLKLSGYLYCSLSDWGEIGKNKLFGELTGVGRGTNAVHHLLDRGPMEAFTSNGESYFQRMGLGK